MNYHQLISKSEEIKTLSQDDNILHVAYGFDDNFSLGTGVSLVSLLENNQHIAISAHLFALSLSKENKTKFIEIAQKYTNLALTIYYVNDQFDINEENKTLFPVSSALRIIIPKILENIAPQVLYIDADTLIVSDLSEFLNFSKEPTIAAVGDFNPEKQIKRINLPSKNYFNAGILFINVPKWCEAFITEKSHTLLIENKFRNPDQDALNILLYNQCHYLPEKYNYQVASGYIENNQPINREKICIIHYIGQDKPWFTFFMPPIYQQYLNISPWKHDKLKTALNAGRIRVASKSMKKSNKLKSFQFYIQYLYYKIFK